MFDRFFRRPRAPSEAKASRVQRAVALYGAGRAVWTPRDYAALSREGFQKNAVVHRAVRLVAEAAFRQAAELAGINADWRGFYLREMGKAVALARVSDLIILGQQERGEEELHIAEHHPTRFLMGAGRPVLMLPNVDSQESARFDTAMVAWNGSREAARALADALPLLKTAKSVTVFSIESAAAREWGQAELPDVDVAAYLSRHGINADVVRNLLDQVDVGEWLLSRATDLNADLLVMGAYGHSRLGELVLGGVTRTILREAFLPVLLSH